MSVSTQTSRRASRPRIASPSASSQLGVHDVNVRAGHFGERHQVMHAFGFDDAAAGSSMPFGSGLAFAEQFLLQLENQIGVLAMRGDDHAELLCQPQRVDKALRR